MVQPQRPLSNEGNPGAAQNTAIQVADAPVKEKGGNQGRAEKAKAKVKGKGKGKGKGKAVRQPFFLLSLASACASEARLCPYCINLFFFNMTY